MDYYVSTDTIMQYSTCIAAIALALVINSKYGKYHGYYYINAYYYCS